MTRKQYNIILVILIALTCVTATALAWLLVRDANTPTPTPTPPLPPTSTTAWDRIQASGKMVVGTSADYPPFAYYTDEFILEGLDIEVINEVGRRMGVQVEIKDMAFDGLSGALDLQQIDLAIAALSITPDRLTVVDFSEIYYVSDAAILSRPDFPESITNIEQVASYRIGVQRGTVYSDWAEEELVDSGLMPASNLFQYEQMDTALSDLREDRVDLLIMDLPVAQDAASSGEFKVAGRDLNTQNYGIAMAKGNEPLLSAINNALRNMQNDGALDQIILKYTGSLPPTFPTPGPQPTPQATATPPPCVDGMKYIADLNLDDNNMTTPPVMAPGQAFKKGWRIQNSGTCTWDSSYFLDYLTGNDPAARMGGQPTPIVGTVPPGAQYDMFVDLVAPLKPGTYQGFWGMNNLQGQNFGDRIWVGIQVPAPPTATPLPTQTPSPTIDFTVDRTEINAGQCVLFTWNVQNASAVYFYPQGEAWDQYPVLPQGTRSECPPVTTTYELRVINIDGSQEIRKITIYVNPVPNAPIINQFTLNPPYEILAGQCVDITWAVQGDINQITILRNDTTLWDFAPVSGAWKDCPPGSGVLTYSLVANGPGGTSRAQRTINVVVPTQPTPTGTPITQTPAPQLPVIELFDVQPKEIEVGQCFTLSWRAGGGATLVDITRNGLTILDDGLISGSEQDCLFDSGPVTYRLTASNNANQTVSEDEQVNVKSSTVTPPLTGTVWQLNFYQQGVNLVTLLPGTEITAVFNDSNNLSGSGGCNTYNASYQISGSAMTIGAVSGTNTTCPNPPGIMQQESAYFAVIPAVTSYDITDNQLRLRNGLGEVVLQYTAGPTPP